MEHQRIQRTSSWSRPAPKRDSGSIEPSKAIQQKKTPASQPQQSLVDRSPEPSDSMQQDPVMRKILANNPVVRQIFQQYSQPDVATQDKDSNDTVQKQTAPAAPAEQSVVDKSPEPSDAVQQDPVMMRILANNPVVRQIFQQQKQPGEKSSESKIQQVAAKGFSGSSTSLPHQNQLQQSFGVDLSDVQAYIGGEAAAACQQIGAQAYASGNQIAFKEQPSLELAAHEAAHVVQQASGKVQLAGGVGKVGDKYENHADAVAVKVVAGESAASLLADFTAPKTDSHPEILSQRQPPTNQNSTESHPSQTTVDRLKEARRLFELGFLKDEEKDYLAAIKFYEASLKLDPNQSIVWYNRGLALGLSNQLESALASTQTALAINNNWGEGQPSFAWNNIGVILSGLGRYNEALQSYKEALRLNPSYELAQTNLRKLEAELSANPSLRNQSQQTPEPEQGNNILQTLSGALLGAFKENQTGEEAIADFLIGLIPIIGQVADARDLAAYLYRIVFKKQFNDIWNWIGLALTLVGLVPAIGDIAKFLGKSGLNNQLPELLKNAEGVLSHLQKLSPEKFDNIAQLKNLLAQNWGKGVKAAQDRWNAILGQLLNWANGIPDLLFSKQKQQLIEAIQEVSGQSNKMLSQAFDRIWEEINKALDAIGRALNPQGDLVTPDGMRVPSNGVDEELNRPMLSQGSESHRQPNRSLEGIRNVANPRDEILLNSIRERLSQGNMKLQELDKGGFGTIYQIPDRPDLVIKLATESQGGINEQLLREATNLFNLAQKGYPTVYKGLIEWVEPNGMIRQGIVMEKVDGALSKRILRTGKFEKEPRDASLEAMVTPKTLEDLKRFRQKADDDDIIIEDLQFMISTRDGSIYLIDPARVEQLPSRGQQRKEKKKQYLTRIDRLIKQFSDLLTNNQR